MNSSSQTIHFTQNTFTEYLICKTNAAQSRSFLQYGDLVQYGGSVDENMKGTPV